MMGAAWMGIDVPLCLGVEPSVQGKAYSQSSHSNSL